MRELLVREKATIFSCCLSRNLVIALMIKKKKNTITFAHFMEVPIIFRALSMRH